MTKRMDEEKDGGGDEVMKRRDRWDELKVPRSSTALLCLSLSVGDAESWVGRAVCRFGSDLSVSEPLALTSCFFSLRHKVSTT